VAGRSWKGKRVTD